MDRIEAFKTTIREKLAQNKLDEAIDILENFGLFKGNNHLYAQIGTLRGYRKLMKYQESMGIIFNDEIAARRLDLADKIADLLINLEDVLSIEDQQSDTFLDNRVLFITSNPRHYQYQQLRIEKEFMRVSVALQGRPFLDLKASMESRIKNFNETILKYKPQVIHFSGHGYDEGDRDGKNDKGIILQDENGEIKRLSVSNLTKMIRAWKKVFDIDLVFLSSCDTLNLGKQIKKILGVKKNVIAMNGAIFDKTALEFSAAFYSFYALKLPIDVCFESAKNQIDILGLDGVEMPTLL